MQGKKGEGCDLKGPTSIKTSQCQLQICSPLASSGQRRIPSTTPNTQWIAGYTDVSQPRGLSPAVTAADNFLKSRHRVCLQQAADEVGNCMSDHLEVS